MRWLLVLAGCAVLAALVGCHSGGGDKSGVEVIIEGGGEFPEMLAGGWKNRGGWEIVFARDGKISSAVVIIGKVRIEPGRTTVVPMKMGGEGTYEPGLWTVQYTPSTRELMVEIVVERINLEMGDGVLAGNLRDVFAGEVSEDYSQWRATWISFPEYVAYTPEPRELPVDPNTTIEELLFTKEGEAAGPQSN